MAMLKDITLGQYFPGNTPLHRMDPRMKILLTIAYIVVLFVADGLVSYLAIIAFLCTAIAISHITPKMILRGMKTLIFIIALTGILNIFYTKGEGKPLLSFWNVAIYKEGIVTAVFMIVRIILLISGTFMLTYTTSPLQLTDGIESLLKPLEKIHVPAHELAMMMSIALRFIPTLIEEADKIMSAQKARGADFESGGLLRRAKALIPLLVPLFISAFRRADELAVAMECRCYHGGEGRTRMRSLKFGTVDLWALLIVAALAAAVILLKIFPVEVFGI